MTLRALFLALALAALPACVHFPPPPPARQTPAFETGFFVARDGAELGLSVWRAERPKAILLALHGMNDYARAFEGLGVWLAEHADITTYAYDQRGFGRSPEFGHWPGEGALVSDLNAAIAALRAQYPGLPVYVLGHSMGGSVVLEAADKGLLDVDGAILAAPGVWGGSRLPLAYRIALNISAFFAPGKTLTGERAHRQSTDNIPVLRGMLADPQVIKATRIDAVLGVVRLMGDAWRASGEVGGRALFLYGAKDQIIPVATQAATAKRLCGSVDVIEFPQGWHLLFRDLEAEKVWRAVASWIEEPGGRGAAGPTQYFGFGPAALACTRAGQGDQRVGGAVRGSPAGR